MAVVSVFVSSTFRDFHGERDILVGPVRAALDERVRALGCRVEIVDLRWGVTAADPEADAESRQRRVLDVCLSEIARSRPLFVGLIGERYGWVPPVARAARVARDAGLDIDVTGRSVTELEFLHGALAQPNALTPVFFERDLVGDVPVGWRESDTSLSVRLTQLRQRIRADPDTVVQRYTAESDGVRVRDLSGFEALAVQVLGPLVEQRARALVAEQERVDASDAVESLFFADRTAVVVGRDELITGVVKMLQSGQSVCLAGPSGMGKSALWCTVVQRLRGCGARVVAVPVGAAPGVTSERMVVARLATQLGAAVPAELTTVEQLRDFWRTLVANVGDVVVAVDALDSLDAGAAREELGFLTGMPVGVIRLVSTTLDRQTELLERTGAERVTVAELPPATVKQVTVGLASVLRRVLPDAAVKSIASQPRSPLWLTLAVGELTALDEDDFIGVDPSADPVVELDSLVTDTVQRLPFDVADLVGVIASRAEHRYGVAAVGAVMRVLVVSRSGLSTADLAAVIGLGEVVVAGVRRAFAGMVEARGAGGRLGFSHGVVREALGRRYLHAGDNLRQSAHAAIARHLLTIDDFDPLREDDVLWHALHAGGEPSAAPILNQIVDPASPRGVRAQRVLADTLGTGAGLDLAEALIALSGDGLWVLLATDQLHGSDMRVEHRRPLIEIALMRARTLSESTPGSPQAGRDLCVALDSVGRLADEVGDLDRARGAFEESLQVARGSLEANPRSVQQAQDLSLALDRVGRLARQVGHLDRARGALEESLQIRRGLFEVNPGSARVARDLTLALDNTGDFAEEIGDLDRALGAYEESLQIRRGLFEANPGSALAARDLTLALDRVGDLARDFGDLNRARGAYEESLQIRRGLFAANPASTQAADDVNLALDRVGGLAHQVGDLATARGAFAESLKVSRGLLESNPGSVQVAHGLTIALNNVGKLAVEVGDLDDARAAFKEFLQISRELFEANPDSAGAARGLSVALGAIGDVAREVGDLDDARAAFEESLRIDRGLLEANPGSTQAARGLSVALGAIGDVARQVGDLDDAHAAFEESLMIERGLFEANPDSAGAARGLMAALNRVGDAARRAGDPDDARAAYEDFQRIARGLLEANPDSATAARDLMTALNRVGMLSREFGDPDGACTPFEESLQIARGLLEANPDSATAARDLSAALVSAGDLARQVGDLDGARDSFEELLQIRRRLFEADPGGARAARGLGVALDGVGGLAIEAGDLNRARDAFEEALQIARDLFEANPSSGQASRDLSVALNKVGRLAEEVGDVDGSRAAFAESVKILRELFGASPGSVEAAYDLCIACWDYARLSDVATGAKHLLEAALVLNLFDSSLLEELRPHVRQRLSMLIPQIAEAYPGLAKACLSALRDLGGA